MRRSQTFYPDDPYLGFNPRTPAGCDIVASVLLTPAAVFQSTHPCGVRHSRHGAGTLRPSRFNPRTPAGCDFLTNAFSIQMLKFQSTHPCGVRHAIFQETDLRADVSIHAPLRGATARRARFGLLELVSIHAPLRGATGGHSVRRAGAGRFNPRTPAGCDASQ